MRGGDDDEDYDTTKVKRVTKKTKNQVIEEIQTAVTQLSKPGGTTLASVQEKDEQVKTLKEVLEEREEQMKDIE